ncbi:TraB/GumN family protein [Nitratireductor sp. GISD-1A_MAKvit]|uniref:TraB/GumN family protein n=1 Tax=Nitratireductor sp. GISD-1A_MAKvit TaxID=3234198 RepID=UPI0034654E54
MKTHARATTAVERLVDRLFFCAAAFPLLLLLALFLGLMIAKPAKADEIVCSGTNLLKELAAKNPAALEEVRRQAAETPNGKGLLWRVEKEGVAPSYLFGTMHLSDPRVVAIPARARQAFDEARPGGHRDNRHSRSEKNGCRNVSAARLDDVQWR